ncbi:MAG: hypothetical protein ACRDTJ_22510 [Pseudonocardiaceae bacterium]
MPRNRPAARPCTQCATGQTVRANGICQSCTRKSKPPTEVSCGDCGKKTPRIEEGTCKDCSMLYESLAADFGKPQAKHALTGGDWSPNPRGVAVWVPYGQEVTEPLSRDEVAIKRQALRMASEFEVLPEARACAHAACGVMFEPASQKQIYCGPQCRHKAYYDRCKQQDGAA